MASDKTSPNDNKDPIRQDSEESPVGSESLDGEGDAAEPGESGSQANPTPEQAPKRKGGRKPVCSGVPLSMSSQCRVPPLASQDPETNTAPLAANNIWRLMRALRING